MSNIAIITARGGSKRIPRKNIKEFAGKPILLYSIEAALKSKIFDEVMVSTDDEEIAMHAINAGASIPFYRSEANSNDYATTSDVILEVLKEYGNRGLNFDVVCCIYPTAPFITSERLQEAVDLLIRNRADCVLPVLKFSFPPQRGLVMNEKWMEPKWSEFTHYRSQDLEPIYHDAGQFYTLSYKRFLEQKKIYMEKTYPIVLSDLEVQDIDTEEDWELAEQKYLYLRNKTNNGAV